MHETVVPCAQACQTGLRASALVDDITRHMAMGHGDSGAHTQHTQHTLEHLHLSAKAALAWILRASATGVGDRPACSLGSVVWIGLAASSSKHTLIDRTEPSTCGLLADARLSSNRVVRHGVASSQRTTTRHIEALVNSAARNTSTLERIVWSGVAWSYVHAVVKAQRRSLRRCVPHKRESASRGASMLPLSAALAFGFAHQLHQEQQQRAD